MTNELKVTDRADEARLTKEGKRHAIGAASRTCKKLHYFKCPPELSRNKRKTETPEKRF